MWLQTHFFNQTGHYLFSFTTFVVGRKHIQLGCGIEEGDKYYSGVGIGPDEVNKYAMRILDGRYQYEEDKS